MILKKCPKCNGELRLDTIREAVDLMCSRCGRGWKKMPDGKWYSRFTAILEVVNERGETEWAEELQ